MTGLELQNARKLLGLSIAEAAEHIGGVAKRSWEYWEREERTIKPDVEKLVLNLLERRREIIKSIIEAGEKAQKLAVIYYDTPEHCASVLEWRFSQSLAIMLSLDFGVNLIKFDWADYQSFCKEKSLKDNQQSRAIWAGFKSNK